MNISSSVDTPSSSSSFHIPNDASVNPENSELASLQGTSSVAQVTSSSHMQAPSAVESVSSSSSPFVGTVVTQAPNPIERTLLTVERQHEVVKKFIQNIRVITCLDALNTFSGTESFNALIADNLTLTGNVFRQLPLVLNNGDEPFRLLLEEQKEGTAARSLIPLIVPARVTSRIRTEEGVEIYTAPDRTPLAEENRAVRKLIREALEVVYADRVIIEECCADLENPTQIENPITINDVATIMLALEGSQKKEHQLSELTTPLSLESQISTEVAKKFVTILL